jgi:hypothetical protein
MANNHGGARPGAGRPRKGETKFEHTEFTPAQLQELLSSPNVASVSRRSVSYTLAFKEMFWQRYCDGVAPIQIFTDAGINPETVGRARINGLAKTLRKNKECGVAFSEGNEPNTNKPEKGFDFPIPPKRMASTTISLDEAARLAHKVEYLSQQLEFVKKIILAGNGGKSKRF